MSNGNGRTKRLIAGSVVGLFGLTFAPSVADAAISTTAFCANVPAGQSGFTDIAQAGVHQRNVECVKGAGVAQGTTATTYAPTANVTRGQMATFIANMIDRANALDAPGAPVIPDLPSAAASTDEFTDDDTNVHEDNINRLAEADIVQGTGGDNYQPDATVSRAQMATFIAEALSFVRAGDLPEGTDAFTDDETSVHEANINRLATADIVDGTSASARGAKATFSPSNVVSRAQMASFVVQGMADLNADGFITPVAPVASTGVTSRPELISAQVIGTVPDGVNAGTTIVYKFDDLGAAVAAGGYFAFDGQGTVYQGDVVSTSSDNTSANVRFTDAALIGAGGAATAASLTLASVAAEFAFADLNGEGNPEGDAPLNNVGATSLPAGITNAPDLVSIGNFRAANGTQTFVDFTFDEPAVDNGGSNEYNLVYTIQGQLAAVILTGQYDHGTGTNVITALFDNIDDDGDASTPIQGVVSARGYVEPGSVSDSTPASPDNVLTAADAAFNGITGGPDLVSASFNLDATNAGNPADAATLVFDEPVRSSAFPGAANPALFSAYTTAGDGSQVNPTSVGFDPNTPNSVLLFFANNDLSGAVGVSVEAGAVENSGGSNVGIENEPDEVGVGNTSSATTSGQTNRPELLTVVRTQALDLFGNPTGGFVVTYTYDEDVATPAAAGHFLYLANGQRMTAVQCDVGATEATDDQVRCVADANNPTFASYTVQGGGEASNAQIAAAVLGTVAQGAVTEQTGGNPNVAHGAAAVG